MAITGTHKTEAADKKLGLTLIELEELLDSIPDGVDGDTRVRVSVGWKSQITRIEIG